jgi:hypothetical protein
MTGSLRRRTPTTSSSTSALSCTTDAVVDGSSTDQKGRTPYRFCIVFDLDDLAERAISRADFVRFLDALRADLKAELARPEEEVAWGAGEWSHPDLDGFLETLAAWLTATPRFDALDSNAWQAFAEMLLAARVYE